jgi:hypothetical protein
LVEVNSIRATTRICGVAFNTVLNFVPAMAEGVTDDVWDTKDIIALI